MGEQTQVQVQAQTQIQSQAQSQSQAQNTLHEPSNSSISIAQATVAISEVMNGPSQTSSPPSKMPLRPRKIRKLSPVESDPSSSLIGPISAGAKPITTRKSSKSKAAQQRAAFASAPIMPTRSLSCEGEVEIALRHLRNADPLLVPLIDLHQRPIFDTFQTPFLALTRSILYQQLAYKAGTSIYTRFIALCGGEAGVLPETVIALNPQQLRQIGISGRKSSYLHDLARKYQNGILSDPAIVNMDDKSLFTMLTMVNGIGSWSVHMFMIFSLHRPDVLPINDLNVRKGVQLLYNLEDLPRPSQMDQLCEKWRPYRSVGSWYMWRLAEAKGASSSAAAVAAGASLQLQQQEHQQEHQPQLLDPLNSILNLGACAWGH